METTSMDLESGLKNMIKINYDKLYTALDYLTQEAPCEGGSCVGYQNCEYGVNGCYGSQCAIEIVQEAMRYYSIKYKEE